ncbi:hypothetical protein [Nocardia salmonicida]|uniref:hypothetical protein n=1 Tax=Nocardia salmonicida TaxID=53431 RepID=UPI003CF617AF
MGPAKANDNRGRKVAATAACKAMAIARKGVADSRASALMLIAYLRMVRTVHWLMYVVGNDDAVSPAHTVLTAIVRFGEILACLHN